MYTAYANYTIFFTDPAEYAAAVALASAEGFSFGYGHCPYTAASTFGITWPLPSGDVSLIPKGMYCSGIWGIPAFPGPGVEVLFPTASGCYIKSDSDNVVVTSPIGGPSMLLVWWGLFILQNDSGVNTPDPEIQAGIPARRFIGGYEIIGTYAEGGSGQAEAGSRVASRVIDGLGFPIRGTATNGKCIRTLTEFVPGIATRSSWERFYIRLNTLGTNDCGIWQGYATGSDARAAIKVSTTGELQVYSITFLNVETLIGTSTFALTLNKWYLIDVLINFPAAAIESGRLRVYINHSWDIDATANAGSGLDTVTFHAKSSLGQWTVAEDEWSIDFDDWINAEIPNIVGVESLTSVDWTMGSHVRRVNNISTVLTDYAGTLESLNQSTNPEATLTDSKVTSTTALATIDTLTDASLDQNLPGLIYGPVAAYIGVNSLSSALVTSRIGYKIAGGATVWLSASYESGVQKWFGTLYNPSQLMIPTDIVPLSLEKEKSNDAVRLNTIFAQAAVVEYIGYFGKEDNADCPDYTNNINYHNCRYGNTIWAQLAGVPDAPCGAIGGTYIGNDGTNTIDLPYPVHMIWVRALTGLGIPIKWFSSGLGGGHTGSTDLVPPNYFTRVYVDSAGVTKFTMAGSNVSNNAAGVVYQYIAFCDPGNRFNINGAYNVPPALTNVVIPLWVTDFLATFGFIYKDEYHTGTGTTQPKIKGPGNAGNTGNNFTGTAIADWGNFTAGNLTVLADNIYSTNTQCTYSLWRTTDSSSCIALQIFSYIGDGLASRVINFPDVTGRWPLLAYVQRVDGTGYFRDPSHTGNNSQLVNASTISVTAIIGGGQDSITVGLTSNTNLAVYNVFIILGDTDGWNNGIFYAVNGPSKGPFVNPTYVPPTPGPGGLNFNGSAGILNVQNLSGIYTLVANKIDDTFYTGVGASTNTVKIPNPMFKTGYIGG